MKSVFLHTFAVGFCFAFAFALLRYFEVDSETKKMIVGLLFVAFEKYTRESAIIPISDWINKK